MQELRADPGEPGSETQLEGAEQQDREGVGLRVGPLAVSARWLVGLIQAGDGVPHALDDVIYPEVDFMG